ncbi:mast cell protease 8-like isoform X2 [Loxodonta africana]|uniref:mast cell protease 8-like isoform X2 n=1 Tax=Loxodonta africana TaxID=9785 RepID=UPI0030D1E082
MMLLLLILLAFPLPSRTFIVIKRGTEARPHSRPYMAFIKYINQRNTWKRCGGFLVREDFVMTAAHCNGREIGVVLGAHNIKNKEETMQEIPVLQAFPHPEFNNVSGFSDIMLLKLKEKARLNSAVRTISLPQSQDWVLPHQMCSVAGWGNLVHGNSSDTLQEVDLQVQNKRACQTIFRYYNNYVNICVGNPRHMKTAAMGDSGAPLVCNNVAQGIVCLGRPRKIPMIYTRISTFVPWIHKIMNAP